MAAPDFSICIPTHNRAALLPALFENLRREAGATHPFAEILIVNDGSTDDTAAVLDRLAAESGLDVRAVHIENAGRGAALNCAFDLARGAFIFIMDDDDLIAPRALADIVATWAGIPESGRATFCGVCGLCVDRAGAVIGQRFPADYTDDDFFSMRMVRGVRGDKREVVLRAVLGDFRFPVFAGETRVITNLLWLHLADRFRMRFVNRPWLVKDYRSDGITRSGLRQKVTSARTAAHYYQTVLQSFPDMPLRLRARFTVNYLRFARHAGMPVTAGLATTGNGALAALLAPLAAMIARQDRRRLAARG